MTTTETYKAHCRKCYQDFEAATAEAAVAKAEEHEKNKCDGVIRNPARKEGK